MVPVPPPGVVKEKFRSAILPSNISFVTISDRAIPGKQKQAAKSRTARRQFSRWAKSIDILGLSNSGLDSGSASAIADEPQPIPGYEDLLAIVGKDVVSDSCTAAPMSAAPTPFAGDLCTFWGIA